jgi:hypothetical protein
MSVSNKPSPAFVVNTKTPRLAAGDPEPDQESNMTNQIFTFPIKSENLFIETFTKKFQQYSTLNSIKTKQKL